MQIIILGMHRSGTSLVTRMVNMMGAYFGPEGSALGFDIDNPKGYWERADVMRLNAAIFKLHNTTWANPTNWPLPHHASDLPPALWKDMKTLVMGLDAHRPWVAKDPRFCLTLPYWQPLLEVPVYVIVHRDPVETARSMETRKNGSMPIDRGIALWEFYCASLLGATGGGACVFASHADFMRDPVAATAKLYDDLKATGVQAIRLPHAKEITAFIDPGLNRSRSPGLQSQHPLTPEQQQLCALMAGEKRTNAPLSVSQQSLKLLQTPINSTHT